jgi:hypothetical protein
MAEQAYEERVCLSYSLFGPEAKYALGMIYNALASAKAFPRAKVVVYVADDVGDRYVDFLKSCRNVEVVPVRRRPGLENALDRFAAIDRPDCDVMFCRDADSGMPAREVACMEDFLRDRHRLLHIIRDHPAHRHTRIMAGMWGMRKGLCSVRMQSLQSLVDEWKRRHREDVVCGYQGDQVFLADVVYPMGVGRAMIHDRSVLLEEGQERSPFRVGLDKSRPCAYRLLPAQYAMVEAGLQTHSA